MIKERLVAFYEENKCLPKDILFYRDGVSESQYGMVKVEELRLIKEGCGEAGKKYLKVDGWCPQITLLVVGKRHHVRFYPQNDKEEKNLYAGLVVDSHIVHPRQQSFYLQSHDCPIGTARSAHYVVIENKSEYSASRLQELVNIILVAPSDESRNILGLILLLFQTNKICFTGARATKSLSVCPPARYADILCDRLRCYMRPALDGTSPPPPKNVDPLQWYRQHSELWNPPDQNSTSHNATPKTNPWHRNMNNVMFYL